MRFSPSAPRVRLALFGDLENGRITKGFLTLTHDIYGYLPTLPDPYVSSYTGIHRSNGARAAWRGCSSR